MADDSGVVQGTLDLLILRVLAWGPQHGYSVARWIKDCSDDAIQVEDRALYLSLHRLEERGWVVAEWGTSDTNRRAKYYSLTPAGRRQLRARIANWTRYAEAVFKIIAAEPGGVRP
jgi:transcriptional regulator